MPFHLHMFNIKPGYSIAPFQSLTCDFDTLSKVDTETRFHSSYCHAGLVDGLLVAIDKLQPCFVRVDNCIGYVQVSERFPTQIFSVKVSMHSEIDRH